MRFRTILPDMLSDLKFTELRDQPGPQHDAQEQRRQAGKCRSEGDVLKDAEGPDGWKEPLIEQIKQHR